VRIPPAPGVATPSSQRYVRCPPARGQILGQVLVHGTLTDAFADRRFCHGRWTWKEPLEQPLLFHQTRLARLDLVQFHLCTVLVYDTCAPFYVLNIAVRIACHVCPSRVHSSFAERTQKLICSSSSFT
jgi:hypothetical protein